MPSASESPRGRGAVPGQAAGGCRWLTLLAGCFQGGFPSTGRCFCVLVLVGGGICCFFLCKVYTLIIFVHNLLMATKYKRVMVPLTPEVQAVFERLSAAQGCSVGRAISDWLIDTMDGAEAIAGLVEKARREPILAMRQMHSYALGLGDMTTEILDGLRKATSSKSEVGGQQQPESGSAEADGRSLRDVLDEAQSRGDALYPPVGNTGGKVPKKPKNRG